MNCLAPRGPPSPTFQPTIFLVVKNYPWVNCPDPFSSMPIWLRNNQAVWLTITGNFCRHQIANDLSKHKCSFQEEQGNVKKTN